MSSFIDYVADKVSPEVLQALKEKRCTGYTHDEIDALERLLMTNITGQFRQFLADFGKSDAGIFKKYLIYHEPDLTLRRFAIAKDEFVTQKITNRIYGISPKATLIKRSDNGYYFIDPEESVDGEPNVMFLDTTAGKSTSTHQTLFAFLLTQLSDQPEDTGDQSVSNLLENLNIDASTPLPPKRQPDAFADSLYQLIYQEDRFRKYQLEQLPSCGFTPEEISRIETIYDFEIKGQLKEWFMSFGCYDGGLYWGYLSMFDTRANIMRAILSIIEYRNDFITFVTPDVPYDHKVVVLTNLEYPSGRETLYFVRTGLPEKKADIVWKIDEHDHVVNTGWNILEFLAEMAKLSLDTSPILPAKRRNYFDWLTVRD